MNDKFYLVKSKYCQVDENPNEYHGCWEVQCQVPAMGAERVITGLDVWAETAGTVLRYMTSLGISLYCSWLVVEVASGVP